MFLHVVDVARPEAIAFDCRFLEDFAAVHGTTLRCTLGQCLGGHGAQAAEDAPHYGGLLGEVLLDRTAADGMRVRSLQRPPPFAFTLFGWYSDQWERATNAPDLAHALPHWAACAVLDYLAGATLWAHGFCAW